MNIKKRLNIKKRKDFQIEVKNYDEKKNILKENLKILKKNLDIFINDKVKIWINENPAPFKKEDTIIYDYYTINKFKSSTGWLSSVSSILGESNKPFKTEILDIYINTDFFRDLVDMKEDITYSDVLITNEEARKELNRIYRHKTTVLEWIIDIEINSKQYTFRANDFIQYSEKYYNKCLEIHNLEKSKIESDKNIEKEKNLLNSIRLYEKC